jgi:alkylmercury lyase-like protein
MDFDTRVKLAIYRRAAETGSVPSAAEIATVLGASGDEAGAAFRRLRDRRVLVLEGDGETIRMAPPFSGVPTQHLVLAGGRSYFANCAWDALGIPACLHAEGEVRSRCERSLEPLRLTVDRNGPTGDSCVAHFAVPAARWWEDIVFT